MVSLKDILGLVQKPQSAATGTVLGLKNMLDPHKGKRDYSQVNAKLDEAERLGIDVSRYAHLRTAAGDAKDPLSGFISGLKGSITPSQAVLELTGGQRATGLPGKATEMTLDVLADPTLFAGGPLKALGKAGKLGKFSKVAEGAGTLGKLEEGNKLGKLGQAGRSYYTGLMATGDPLLALSAAPLMKVAENKAVQYAPAVMRKLSSRAGVNVADLSKIVDNADDVVAPDEIKQLALFDMPAETPKKLPKAAGEVVEVVPTKTYEDVPLQRQLKELPAGPRAGSAPVNLPSYDQVMNEVLQPGYGSQLRSASSSYRIPNTEGALKRVLEQGSSVSGKSLTEQQKQMLTKLLQHPESIPKTLRPDVGRTFVDAQSKPAPKVAPKKVAPKPTQVAPKVETTKPTQAQSDDELVSKMLALTSKEKAPVLAKPVERITFASEADIESVIDAAYGEDSPAKFLAAIAKSRKLPDGKRIASKDMTKILEEIGTWRST